MLSLELPFRRTEDIGASKFIAGKYQLVEAYHLTRRSVTFLEEHLVLSDHGAWTRGTGGDGGLGGAGSGGRMGGHYVKILSDV